MSRDNNGTKPNLKQSKVNRRNILLGGTTLAATSAFGTSAPMQAAQAKCDQF
jgi:hypothetical protein